MLEKLTLKDFQSHLDTTLDFSSGYNAIIGNNGNGKTSIVRALKLLFLNQPKGNGFVRRPEGVISTITAVLDGKTVTRIKGQDINQYFLDVEKWEEFGDKIPRSILEHTKVRLIKSDTDQSFNLQFSFQLEGPFLFTESDSVKAKFLNRLSGAYVLDVVLRQLLSDQRNANEFIKTIESELTFLDKEVQKYNKVPSLKSAIRHIEEKLIELRSLEGEITTLKTLQKKLSSWKTSYQKLQLLQTNLRHINISKLQQDLVKLEALKGLEAKLYNLDNNIHLTKLTIQERQTERHKYEEEYHSQLASLEVCPLCGSKIIKEVTGH